MEQLVEHVNLEHLSLSSPIPPTAPCQWGDCHEQLSQQPELSLDVLANHLFQDHLMWPASMEVRSCLLFYTLYLLLCSPSHPLPLHL